MRRVVYEGINYNTLEKIETTSYDVMKECKEEGFEFKVRLDKIYKVNKEVEKENEKRREKIWKKA